MQNSEFLFPPSTNRSQLFRLSQHDNGGLREGLRSYLIRLARSHSLSPRRLVEKVLSIKYEAIHEWTGSSFYYRDSGTINGLGEYANTFSKSITDSVKLETQQLTLLGLRNILPHNGAGLLARRPKWCPVCIAEQLRSSFEAWHPLVWSFDFYRACIKHGCEMEEECPSCNSNQPFIPIYPDLAHCDSCGYLLSLAKAKALCIDITLSDPKYWVARELENLVSNLEVINTLGTLECFRATIKVLVHHYAEGNNAKFCRSIGLQTHALNGWFSKGQRPSFQQILKIAYATNLAIIDMLVPSGTVQNNIKPDNIKVVPNKLGQRTPRPKLGKADLEKLSKRLDLIINNPEDVRPAQSVALEVGLTRSSLKYWFPEEFARLVIKHSSHKSQLVSKRHESQKLLVSKTVENLVRQGKFPGRKRVDAALRKHGASLMRIDLLEEFHRSVELQNKNKQ